MQLLLDPAAALVQRVTGKADDVPPSAAPVPREARCVIDALIGAVPAPLVELRKLGRTLGKRAEDVLAYFERPRTSNGALVYFRPRQP